MYSSKGKSKTGFPLTSKKMKDRFKEIHQLAVTSWPTSHRHTGTKWTESDTKKYIEADSENLEYSEIAWGTEIHNKWQHYLECKSRLPSPEQSIELKVMSDGLTTASENLLEYFEYDSVTRVWNPTESISLNRGYKVLEDMLALQKGAELIEDESSWIIGNIAATLQDLYPDDYDHSLVAKATNRAVKTVIMYCSVFRAFKGRRIPGVRFSHHKDIYYTANLPVEEGIMVLKKAQTENLSWSDTKNLGKVVALKTSKKSPVTEISEELMEEAVKGNIPSGTQRYFIITKTGNPQYKTGKLPKETLRTAQYICMLRPNLSVIKGPEKIKI